MRPHSADAAFFDCHSNLMRGEEFADHFGIKRLGKAQISNGGAEPFGFEPVCGLECFLKPRAERQDRDLFSLTDNPALTNLKPDWCFGQRNTRAITARIAQRDRAAVIQRTGVHHVHQLSLVSRRHDDKVWQRAEVGDIKATRVRAAIGSDQPGAVDRKTHGQILDRHIMDNLIISTLEEGRINCRERTHSLCS